MVSQAAIILAHAAQDTDADMYLSTEPVARGPR